MNRSKRGFGAPIGPWFRRELRGVAADVLLDPHTLGRGIFSQEAVRRMLDEHVSGRVSHRDHIWELLMLELWFRTYIDRPRSDLTGPAEGILPESVHRVS